MKRKNSFVKKSLAWLVLLTMALALPMGLVAPVQAAMPTANELANVPSMPDNPSVTSADLFGASQAGFNFGRAGGGVSYDLWELFDAHSPRLQLNRAEWHNMWSEGWFGITNRQNGVSFSFTFDGDGIDLIVREFQIPFDFTVTIGSHTHHVPYVELGDGGWHQWGWNVESLAFSSAAMGWNLGPGPHTMTITSDNILQTPHGDDWGQTVVFSRAVVHGGAASFDPTVEITQGGTRIAKTDPGFSLFTLASVPVSPGALYSFCGWMFMDGTPATDGNPGFFVVDPSWPAGYGMGSIGGASGSFVVDRWELAVPNGWAHVYGPWRAPNHPTNNPPGFSHFMAPAGGLVYLVVRFQSTTPMYIYGLALTNLDSGEIASFDLADFTPSGAPATLTALTRQQLIDAMSPPRLNPPDTGFRFAQSGTEKAPTAGGTFRNNGVPVNIGDEYKFTAWVHSGAFSLDANPHLLAFEPTNGNRMVVDKWEHAVQNGWAYVFEDRLPTPGQNFSRFVAEASTVDLEVRLRTVTPQFIYRLALTNITTGEVRYFNLEDDFTPATPGVVTRSAAELNEIFFGGAGGPEHVPVTGILDVPTTGYIGRTILRGNVFPTNATRRTIIWSVVDQGTTGATVSANNLITQSVGTVTIRATILAGGVNEANFTQDFPVVISEAPIRSGNPNYAITNPGWMGGGGRAAIFWDHFPSVPGRTYIAGAWITGGGQPNLRVRNHPNYYHAINADWPANPYVWEWRYVRYTAPTAPGEGFRIDYNWDTGFMGGEGEYTFFYGMSIMCICCYEELITPDFWSVDAWNSWFPVGRFVDISAAELLERFPVPRIALHVPVDEILNVPTILQVGTRTLFGTVVPERATERDIGWSIASAGTTGAAMLGNMLVTAAPGTVVVTATIVGGGPLNTANQPTNFTQNFTIEITADDLNAPDPTKPYIFHVPYLQLPGGVGSIFGGQLTINGGNATVAIQPLTGFNGALNPETAAFTITPFNTICNIIQYEIPDGIPYDVWALWVQNDEGNWSDMRLVNQPEIMWVTEHTVYPGQRLIIAGRNMVNPTNRSADGVAVEFVPIGGGAALRGIVEDLTDYSVTFFAPTGLVPGVQYDIRFSNGAGGALGFVNMNYAYRERVTAVARNANIAFFDSRIDLNVAWVSAINTSNLINIRDQIPNWDPAGYNDAAAAIATALASMGPNGGVLYFPAGRYTIDRIELPNNVAMIGDGPDRTFLTWRGTTDQPGRPLIFSTGTTVVVANMSLANPFHRMELGLGRSMLGNVIAFTNAAMANYRVGGYALKNLNIYNHDGNGVSISGPRPAIIENTSIDVLHAAVGFTNGLVNPRIINSHLKNRHHANIANAGDGLMIKNSIIEGDSLGMYVNNRALADFEAFVADGLGTTVGQYNAWAGRYRPLWYEVDFVAMGGFGSEHRPMDTNGGEMLYIGNRLTGVFGADVDNAGEGITMQAFDGITILGPPVSATSTSVTTGADTTAIGRGPHYIKVVAGPGIGQIRRVVHYFHDNGTLYIDEPWHMIPTSETRIKVYQTHIANVVFANSIFEADLSKADIYYFKSYNMTISNNQFIGGGSGIWYSSWGGGASYHYHLMIFNNLFTNSTSHFFSVNSQIIGPVSDATTGVGGGPDTIVYGIHKVHNTFRGHGTDAAALLPPYSPVWEIVNPGWWAGARWEYLDGVNIYLQWNGIFISHSHGNNPNNWGAVLEGNHVTNTVNGIHLGSQTHDAVLRNNHLVGNNRNLVGANEAINLHQIATGGIAAPGVITRGPINLAALAPVTVTFNANGGTPATQTRQTARGTTVGVANMPAVTRTGFTFTSWNTASDGSGNVFTGTTAVTDNITVYAQWRADTVPTPTPTPTPGAGATTPRPTATPTPTPQGPIVDETITVEADEVQDVLEQGQDLVVSDENDIVTVTIPNDVLQNLVDANNPEDVTVEILVTPGDGGNRLVVVGINILVGDQLVASLPGAGTYSVEVSLTEIGLTLDGMNTYRIVAMLPDGTLLGGIYNTATGLFVFEAGVSGEFTITYVRELRRLRAQMGSYQIIDLAANVVTQQMDVTPIIVQNRMMLPLRFVSNALGATVDWTPASSSAGTPLIVHLTHQGRPLNFGIGEMVAGMDVPAQLMQNRTMVPLRFVSEFFGAVVTWDPATRTAEIIHR